MLATEVWATEALATEALATEALRAYIEFNNCFMSHD
jgi:hypothetical protein